MILDAGTTTVTTAGTGYHAGNVCFTLKSRGNTGYTTYVIKQIECYIPNKLESAAFSRAPTGDIYAGRNVVANFSTAVISGDICAKTSEITWSLTLSVSSAPSIAVRKRCPASPPRACAARR